MNFILETMICCLGSAFLLTLFWGHNKHHFPGVLAGCLQIILYSRLAQQVATEYGVIYSERHKTSCRDDETIMAIKNGNYADHVIEIGSCK